MHAAQSKNAEGSIITLLSSSESYLNRHCVVSCGNHAALGELDVHLHLSVQLDLGPQLQIVIALEEIAPYVNAQAHD